MLISIIIPVYKVEEYLHRCIDSVLEQSFSDYEIILVDDGSPDNCPSICDRYCEKDKRITVIHKENGGLSDARNSGLKIAKGEYVLFLDSDDYYLKGSLDVISRFLNVDKPDILIGNLINEDGTKYSPNALCDIGKMYLGIDYYTHFCKTMLDCAVASAYRLSFLKSNALSFLVGRYHEDSDFTPKAYFAAKSVIHSNVDFYVRTSRDDSITTKKDKRKNLEDCLFIARNMVTYADGIKNTLAKEILLENICLAYLGKFVDANIYQYKDCDYKKYIDKKLINEYLKRRLFRKILFCLSPKLYVLIAKWFRKK